MTKSLGLVDPADAAKLVGSVYEARAASVLQTQGSTSLEYRIVPAQSVQLVNLLALRQARQGRVDDRRSVRGMETNGHSAGARTGPRPITSCSSATTTTSSPAIAASGEACDRSSTMTAISSSIEYAKALEIKAPVVELAKRRSVCFP